MLFQRHQYDSVLHGLYHHHESPISWHLPFSYEPHKMSEMSEYQPISPVTEPRRECGLCL